MFDLWPERVSKKFAFAFMSIMVLVGILLVVLMCHLEMWLFVAALCSSQLSVLVVTVTYLTGQAKVDVSLQYGKDSHGDNK
jgi:hypothetical protein